MEVVFTDNETSLFLDLTDCSYAEGKQIMMRLDNSDNGFAGQSMIILPPNAWSDFIDDLEELDRTRQGSAAFHCMGSKIELSSMNSTGQLGVSGTITLGTHTISFVPFPFDPTDFSKMVTRMRDA